MTNAFTPNYNQIFSSDGVKGSNLEAKTEDLTLKARTKDLTLKAKASY